MKKTELIKMIKEEYSKIMKEEKAGEVNIEYSNGKRVLHLPNGWTGADLKKWLTKYGDKLKGTPEKP